MSERDFTPNADLLSTLPGLPRELGGPVFAEPWQRRVFALAIYLSQQGHFTWTEWVTALTEELKTAADRGNPDDRSRYYHHWLAALERIVAAKGLASPGELLACKKGLAEQIDAHGRRAG